MWSVKGRSYRFENRALINCGQKTNRSLEVEKN